MSRETCEFCRYRFRSESMEDHHIVPTQITEEAGMPESQTVRLCNNCHQEVHSWYKVKVAHQSYDLATKRFRDKSGLDMIKEYQATFHSFSKYKQEQRKRKKVR